MTDLRRQSRWLARLTLILLLARALVTVAPVLIGFALAPARGLPAPLAWAAVLWLPVPFYLYALWAIRGGLLQFDVAYLAVGVVGLALVLLGRLLARAAEVQREADRLADELGGFF